MRRQVSRSRRSVLLGLFALSGTALLAGCGWRPVYRGGAGGLAGPAEAGLAETSVALIPERTGQLLRQALQARFDSGSGSTGQRYMLAVSSFSIAGEAIGIQRDNSISRVRLVGTASWVLSAQDAQRRTLTSGTARQMDGYNIVGQQYFAADLESEAVQRRIAEAVADQITLQVAAFFNRHAAGG
ncbi:MAG: hypothetical protein ABS99_08670 [Acetobacteraceae bacterium SCN 69-10]|nr:hypothetical protein [Rhodospirillales bacterium]ODU54797.1 MAG: hypothetical protein ABS99_08670 [Acetobacteraceae bacterium SCN 69-10]OJY65634.1 MAG: hypothetical protein BGP12_17380 [Rhodospirillales bacterium 70-18]